MLCRSGSVNWVGAGQRLGGATRNVFCSSLSWNIINNKMIKLLLILFTIFNKFDQYMLGTGYLEKEFQDQNGCRAELDALPLDPQFSQLLRKLFIKVLNLTELVWMG